MIAVFDDFLLGVVMDENVVDVTPLVSEVTQPAMRPYLLAELVSRYDEIGQELLEPKGRTVPLKDVRLRAASLRWPPTDDRRPPDNRCTQLERDKDDADRE